MAVQSQQTTTKIALLYHQTTTRLAWVVVSSQHTKARLAWIAVPST
jgi:hypothetical protein